MEVNIKINEYKEQDGIKLNWELGYSINCVIKDKTVIISANKEGLISLANHLITLAQKNIPNGSHIHLDNYNSLEDNSDELILCKT